MKRSDILIMLDCLFDEFNIDPVHVTIKNVKRTYGGREIQIGLKVVSTLKRIEDIILHEFAHTLDWRLNGNRIKNGRAIWHDQIFTELLEKVVSAWYGNNKSYQWGGEYPSIKKIIKTKE